MQTRAMRSSCVLLAIAALAAACGGGGGGSSTADVSGRLRTPEVAPSVLTPTAFSPHQAMLAGEVVVWRDPGVAAEELAMAGFELLRGGDGPISVYRALAAAGRSYLRCRGNHDGAARCDRCQPQLLAAALCRAERHQLPLSVALPEDQPAAGLGHHHRLGERHRRGARHRHRVGPPRL
jgi:hypothetical protein